MTEYPHQKPSLIFRTVRLLVTLLRVLFGLFLVLMAAWACLALWQMFAWWSVPIVLVFGFAVFVLFRNRWRRLG